jgi:hypothetical protein
MWEPNSIRGRRRRFLDNVSANHYLRTLPGEDVNTKNEGKTFGEGDRGVDHIKTAGSKFIIHIIVTVLWNVKACSLIKMHACFGTIYSLDFLP